MKSSRRPAAVLVVMSAMLMSACHGSSLSAASPPPKATATKEPTPIVAQSTATKPASLKPPKTLIKAPLKAPVVKAPVVIASPVKAPPVIPQLAPIGLVQAATEGIPIDTEAITALPALATVPVLPPKGSNSGGSGSSRFPKIPKLPAGRGGQAGIESATVPATLPTTPFQPVKQAIWASGTQFMQGPNQPFYFTGTNTYNLVDASAYTKASVYNSLVQHWNAGIRVVRIFAFNNGPNPNSKMPIQEPVGVFHEDALRHYDYVLATAGAIGIRLILCLTNHWDVYNGNQWYVDQTLGPGHDLEEFYTAPAARAAYKKWVSTIIGRTNTVNGRQYKNDPTVFAWELCNECHTWDYYEISRGIIPGTLLYNWEVEMIPYFRSLGFTQMLTNGAEGYRANTTHDSSAPTTYPFNNWLNDGRKGEDFVRNLGIPGIDFYGIHVYPDAWGADATTDSWFNENYIGDRARLVHQITGKPIIMEECGTTTTYGNRDNFVASYFKAANKNGYAGTFVWAVYANVLEVSFLVTNGFEGYPGYNYIWSQMGSLAVRTQAKYMNSRTAGCGSCSDTVPPPGTFSCAQQAHFGTCWKDWMVKGGFCQITCGRCPNCAAPVTCEDKPPPTYTCAEQAAWGACFDGWMIVGDGSTGGYCASTCGRCVGIA